MATLRIFAFAAASIVGGFFATAAIAAPAAAPVTTEQFVERCKADARFCRTQITAIEALLEKTHKACLRARVSKDAMAEKVHDVIEDIIDDVPELKTNPYRAVVEQVIMFNWPCEPIS